MCACVPTNERNAIKNLLGNKPEDSRNNYILFLCHKDLFWDNVHFALYVSSNAITRENTTITATTNQSASICLPLGQERRTKIQDWLILRFKHQAVKWRNLRRGGGTSVVHSTKAIIINFITSQSLIGFFSIHRVFSTLSKRDNSTKIQSYY